MAQRSMSSGIDGAMSTRNQGALVSTRRVTTQTMRVPGLQEVPTLGKARPIAPGTLAGVGEFSVTLPVVGTVSWGSLILGAGIALVGLQIYRRRRASA